MESLEASRKSVYHEPMLAESCVTERETEVVTSSDSESHKVSNPQISHDVLSESSTEVSVEVARSSTEFSFADTAMTHKERSPEKCDLGREKVENMEASNNRIQSNEAELSYNLLTSTAANLDGKNNMPADVESCERVLVVLKYQKNVFMCEACGISSTDSVRFDEHIARHILSKPYICLACKVKFQSKAEMEKHAFLIHENNRKKCALQGMKMICQITSKLRQQGIYSFKGIAGQFISSCSRQQSLHENSTSNDTLSGVQEKNQNIDRATDEISVSILGQKDTANSQKHLNEKTNLETDQSRFPGSSLISTDVEQELGHSSEKERLSSHPLIVSEPLSVPSSNLGKETNKEFLVHSSDSEKKKNENSLVIAGHFTSPCSKQRSLHEKRTSNDTLPRVQEKNKDIDRMTDGVSVSVVGQKDTTNSEKPLKAKTNVETDQSRLPFFPLFSTVFEQERGHYVDKERLSTYPAIVSEPFSIPDTHPITVGSQHKSLTETFASPLFQRENYSDQEAGVGQVVQTRRLALVEETVRHIGGASFSKEPYLQTSTLQGSYSSFGPDTTPYLKPSSLGNSANRSGSSVPCTGQDVNKFQLGNVNTEQVGTFPCPSMPPVMRFPGVRRPRPLLLTFDQFMNHITHVALNDSHTKQTQPSANHQGHLPHGVPQQQIHHIKQQGYSGQKQQENSTVLSSSNLGSPLLFTHDVRGRLQNTTLVKSSGSKASTYVNKPPSNLLSNSMANKTAIEEYGIQQSVPVVHGNSPARSITTPSEGTAITHVKRSATNLQVQQCEATIEGLDTNKKKGVPRNKDVSINDCAQANRGVPSRITESRSDFIENRKDEVNGSNRNAKSRSCLDKGMVPLPDSDKAKNTKSKGLFTKTGSSLICNVCRQITDDVNVFRSHVWIHLHVMKKVCKKCFVNECSDIRPDCQMVNSIMSGLKFGSAGGVPNAKIKTEPDNEVTISSSNNSAESSKNVDQLSLKNSSNKESFLCEHCGNVINVGNGGNHLCLVCNVKNTYKNDISANNVNSRFSDSNVRDNPGRGTGELKSNETVSKPKVDRYVPIVIEIDDGNPVEVDNIDNSLETLKDRVLSRASSHLQYRQSQSNTKGNRMTYACKVTGCGYHTYTLEEFLGHLEISHVKNKKYPCDHCKENFNSFEELMKHCNKKVIKTIHCPHCTFQDVELSVVSIHITKFHPDALSSKIKVTSQLVCGAKVNHSEGIKNKPGVVDMNRKSYALSAVITMNRIGNVDYSKQQLNVLPCIQKNASEKEKQEVCGQSSNIDEGLTQPPLQREYSSPQLNKKVMLKEFFPLRNEKKRNSRKPIKQSTHSSSEVSELGKNRDVSVSDNFRNLPGTSTSNASSAQHLSLTNRRGPWKNVNPRNSLNLSMNCEASPLHLSKRDKEIPSTGNLQKSLLLSSNNGMPSLPFPLYKTAGNVNISKNRLNLMLTKRFPPYLLKKGKQKDFPFVNDIGKAHDLPLSYEVSSPQLSQNEVSLPQTSKQKNNPSTNELGKSLDMSLSYEEPSLQISDRQRVGNVVTKSSEVSPQLLQNNVSENVCENKKVSYHKKACSLSANCEVSMQSSKDVGRKKVSGIEERKKRIKSIYKLRCHNCSYVGRTSEYLQEHSLLHSSLADRSGKPFHCQICPGGQETLKDFLEHMNCHVGIHELKLLCCNICDYISNVHTLVILHLVQTHPLTLFWQDLSQYITTRKLSITASLLECGTCAYASTFTDDFNKHIATHEKETDAESDKQSAESDKRRAESDKRRAESDKQRAESDKQRAESDKRRAESGSQIAEFHRWRGGQSRKQSNEKSGNEKNESKNVKIRSNSDERASDLVHRASYSLKRKNTHQKSHLQNTRVPPRIEMSSETVDAQSSDKESVILGMNNCDFIESEYFQENLQSCFQKSDFALESYDCKFCQSSIGSKYKIHKHVLKHLNVWIFKCGYCKYRVLERSKLQSHHRSCHGNIPVKYKQIDTKELTRSIQKQIQKLRSRLCKENITNATTRSKACTDDSVQDLTNENEGPLMNNTTNANLISTQLSSDTESEMDENTQLLSDTEFETDTNTRPVSDTQSETDAYTQLSSDTESEVEEKYACPKTRKKTSDSSVFLKAHSMTGKQSDLAKVIKIGSIFKCSVCSYKSSNRQVVQAHAHLHKKTVDTVSSFSCRADKKTVLRKRVNERVINTSKQHHVLRRTASRKSRRLMFHSQHVSCSGKNIKEECGNALQKHVQNDEKMRPVTRSSKENFADFCSQKISANPKSFKRKRIEETDDSAKVNYGGHAKVQKMNDKKTVTQYRSDWVNTPMGREWINSKSKTTGKIHKCILCGQKFANRQNVKRHIAEVCLKETAVKRVFTAYCLKHNKKSDICQNKSDAFSMETFTKREGSAFTCTLCPYQSVNFLALKRHAMKMHKKILRLTEDESDVKQHNATHCIKPKNLKRHMEHVHKTDKQDGGHFKCPVCGLMSQYGKFIKNHMKIAHPKHKWRTITKVQNTSHDKKSSGRNTFTLSMQNVFKCNGCKRSFRSTKLLFKHFQGECGNTLYRCPLCRSHFSFKTSIVKAHALKEHGEKVVPISCSKSEKYRRYRVPLRKFIIKHNQQKDCIKSEMPSADEQENSSKSISCNKWQDTPVMNYSKSNMSQIYCTKCDFVAVTTKAFQFHCNKYHIGQILNCELCSWFSTRSILHLKHHTIKEHHKAKNLKFSITSTTNSTNSSVTVNGNSESDDKNICYSHENLTPIVCKECDYVGLTLNAFKYHCHRKHHGMAFVCLYCSRGMGMTIMQLAYHIKQVHGHSRLKFVLRDPSARNSPPKRQGKHTVNSEEHKFEDWYSCHLCAFSTNDLHRFSSHIACHDMCTRFTLGKKRPSLYADIKVGGFLCSYCDKQEVNLPALKHHTKTSHPGHVVDGIRLVAKDSGFFEAFVDFHPRVIVKDLGRVNLKMTRGNTCKTMEKQVVDGTRLFANDTVFFGGFVDFHPRVILEDIGKVDLKMTRKNIEGSCENEISGKTLTEQSSDKEICDTVAREQSDICDPLCRTTGNIAERNEIEIIEEALTERSSDTEICDTVAREQGDICDPLCRTTGNITERNEIEIIEEALTERSSDTEIYDIVKQEPDDFCDSVGRTDNIAERSEIEIIEEALTEQSSDTEIYDIVKQKPNDFCDSVGRTDNIAGSSEMEITEKALTEQNSDTEIHVIVKQEPDDFCDSLGGTTGNISGRSEMEITEASLTEQSSDIEMCEIAKRVQGDINNPICIEDDSDEDSLQLDEELLEKEIEDAIDSSKSDQRSMGPSPSALVDIINALSSSEEDNLLEM